MPEREKILNQIEDENYEKKMNSKEVGEIKLKEYIF